MFHNNYIILLNSVILISIFLSIRAIYSRNYKKYLEIIKTIVNDLYNVLVDIIAFISSFNIALFIFDNSSIYIQLIAFLIIIGIIMIVRHYVCRRLKIKEESLIIVFAALLFISFIANEINTSDPTLQRFLDNNENFYSIEKILRKEKIVSVQIGLSFVDPSSSEFISLEEFIISDGNVYSLYRTFNEGYEYIVQIFSIEEKDVIQTRIISGQDKVELEMFNDTVFIYTSNSLASISEDGEIYYFDISEDTLEEHNYLLYEENGILYFQESTGLYEYDSINSIFNFKSEVIDYSDKYQVYSVDLSLVITNFNEELDEYSTLVDGKLLEYISVASVNGGAISSYNSLYIDGEKIDIDELLAVYEVDSKYYIFSDDEFYNKVIVLDENLKEIEKFYDTASEARSDDYSLNKEMYLVGEQDYRGNYNIYELSEPVYSLVSVSLYNYNYFIFLFLCFGILPKIKEKK